MVSAYTNTDVAVASSAAIPFNTNRFVTGCGNSHAAGTPTVTLRRPGFYLVSFDGDVLAGASTGTVTVQLANNGTVVPGALQSQQASAEGDAIGLGFSTVVRVLNSCSCIDNTANLTILNTGLASTYTNAEINVVKLN